jgi:hypothetical protein
MTIIRSIAGRSVVFVGERQRRWLPSGASVLEATPQRKVVLDLRIVGEASDAVVLEWQSRNAEDRGDRWYPNLGDAIREAQRLFGIAASEWATQ